MATKKALPDDVENFFEGESVFFNDEVKDNKPKVEKKPERVNGRTEQPNERTVKPKEIVSVVDDEILKAIKEGKKEDVEKTERYSFEIYPTQREAIEDFLYKYKKTTGERLSASKLIREAIQQYLDKVTTQVGN